MRTASRVQGSYGRYGPSCQAEQSEVIELRDSGGTHASLVDRF